jgi:hypothetical protein
LLRRQLKQMQNDKDIPGISCGLVDDNNVFEWEVMLMINDECKFYGGKFLPASQRQRTASCHLRAAGLPPSPSLTPPWILFETDCSQAASSVRG